MQGCRQYRGFWVPDDERERAIERRFNSEADIDAVTRLCVRLRVAVQAGGNWGYWPLRMSKAFRSVYTFEPDFRTFCCLAANTAGQEGIYRLQAALGEASGLTALERFDGRSGKTMARGDGAVPVMSIDSLHLTACDLIYLDIEGGEPAALKGAVETIRQHRPVIAFEDKGHAERGAAEKWLLGMEYRVHSYRNHDTVMVPC